MFERLFLSLLALVAVLLLLHPLELDLLHVVHQLLFYLVGLLQRLDIDEMLVAKASLVIALLLIVSTVNLKQ